MEQTFKSAVFGGFDREDVVRYIEKTAQETQERIGTLESEKENLLRDSAALRSALDEMTAARDELSTQLGAAEEAKALDAQALADARVELETLRDSLARLTAEHGALQREVETLREQAGEYDAVKAHIADIELSARARADALEADTRRRMRETLAECRGRCEEVFVSLRTACTDAAAQLRTRCEDLDTLPGIFTGICDGLIESAPDEPAQVEPVLDEPVLDEPAAPEE